jgi:trk system potassium uptake protein TrkH
MRNHPPTLAQALGTKYRTLTSAVGRLIALIGVGHLLPLLVIPFRPEERTYFWPFVLPSMLGLLLGGVMAWRWRPRENPYALSVKDGGILVIAVWGTAMCLGALPFWLGGQVGLLNSLFESVSGWTTTGLSVLDVDATPHIFLLWRALTQYVGALGIVLIGLVAIIGPSAQALYQAEGRSALLRPHVGRTVRLIVAIYLGLTLAMLALYWVGGMSGFDALIHAMCTVSTGGFSSRSASFGHWASPLLEYLAILLMWIASTNYATHFAALQGRWRQSMRNREWRLAGAILLLSIPLVFFALAAVPGYGWTWQSLRTAGFEAVAALSSTGFTSATYAGWPDLALFLLTLLMLIGGGTGSTAGGIKQYRIYLLLKSIGWELRRRLLPRRAVLKNRVWNGTQKVEVDSEELVMVGAFVGLYLVVYVVAVIIFMLYDYPLRDSLFQVASSISTIGLSVGITGPLTPIGIRLTQMAVMILGRLEFFVLVFGTLNLGRDLRLWRQSKMSVTEKDIQ